MEKAANAIRQDVRFICGLHLLFLGGNTLNADELKKEAERIGKILIYGELEDAKAIELLHANFRDVHEAAYAEALQDYKADGLEQAFQEGFRQAKEKAEKIVQVRINERYSSDCPVEAEQMRDEIRAVNSGDGEIYGR